MYKLTMKKVIVPIVLLFLVVVLTSALVAYFVARSQSNVRFISEPREDNPDYGYLEINGREYYQLYTTAQDNIGNGLHIHRIDLRGSDPKSEWDYKQREHFDIVFLFNFETTNSASRWFLRGPIQIPFFTVDLTFRPFP